MDFDAAMAAHADWKVNLRIAMETRAHVDVERASSDCNCALGRWLHGEAKSRLAGDRTYLQCVEAHRDFHKSAGEIAVAINRGDTATAARLLEGGSPFSTASLQVAVAIRRLKTAVPA
ncbi:MULTISPECIES: CZB domain-containing protein [unclassified Caulobacter]|jgi:hypothetical protein|uniref:CZB domain-containing protein n=1 Tax=unclassified Caulobacter TaxID=2648921 RepID=UPI000781E59A|nr:MULTISPECIES: CZB domain-containing protein [unclassified Caulobacter]AZS22519.1 hypothetical protein CSW63_18925 [Caulobacter sp. FWC26]